MTYWEPVIIHSPIKDQYWDRVKEYFPEYQRFLFNQKEELVGLANTIPLFWKGKSMDLPEEGWDWLVETSIKQYESNLKPNIFGGLQIIVFEEFRNQGYSKLILDEMKRIFRESMFEQFILPIRPILKSEFPKIPMDIYMRWKKKEVAFDPWIRVHEREGAKILKVCSKSMCIEGKKSEWEAWTGISIHGSGNYSMPGGLSPLYYNRETDIGYYKEPNIWVSYHK